MKKTMSIFTLVILILICFNTKIYAQPSLNSRKVALLFNMDAGDWEVWRKELASLQNDKICVIAMPEAQRFPANSSDYITADFFNYAKHLNYSQEHLIGFCETSLDLDSYYLIDLSNIRAVQLNGLQAPKLLNYSKTQQSGAATELSSQDKLNATMSLISNEKKLLNLRPDTIKKIFNISTIQNIEILMGINLFALESLGNKKTRESINNLILHNLWGLETTDEVHIDLSGVLGGSCKSIKWSIQLKNNTTVNSVRCFADSPAEGISLDLSLKYFVGEIPFSCTRSTQEQIFFKLAQDNNIKLLKNNRKFIMVDERKIEETLNLIKGSSILSSVLQTTRCNIDQNGIFLMWKKIIPSQDDPFTVVYFQVALKASSVPSLASDTGPISVIAVVLNSNDKHVRLKEDRPDCKRVFLKKGFRIEASETLVPISDPSSSREILVGVQCQNVVVRWTDYSNDDLESVFNSLFTVANTN